MVQLGLVWGFSQKFDYVRVARFPPESPYASLLILDGTIRSGSDAPVAYKLLWEDVDDTGRLLHVSKIHAVFNDTELGGLVFEYGGGRMRRSAGMEFGERHTLVLEEGEVPTRLEEAIFGSPEGYMLAVSTTTCP